MVRKCSRSLQAISHAVLAVGYGPDYWLVKNSYGKKWGMEGYIKMKRGVPARVRTGNCGITFMASYPLV